MSNVATKWQVRKGTYIILDDEEKDNIIKKTVHKNKSNEASLDISTGILAS